MNVLFNIGDIIVYGAQGICKIDCIEQKQIGKNTVDYYVLKPFCNLNTSVFVPVDNEMVTSKMLDVLTADEAKKLVSEAASAPCIKFESENRKREQYNAILASNDRQELSSLIKTIRLERETRYAVGKKLNIVDEQTLRKAEMLLFNELAYVLEVTVDEIQNMIKF